MRDIDVDEVREVNYADDASRSIAAKTSLSL
jgi:hypothetical protein